MWFLLGVLSMPPTSDAAYVDPVRNRARALTLAMIGVAVSASPAVADDEVRTWHGMVMPYVWLPASVGGSVTLGPESVTMQANMADMLGRLEMAASLRAEVWYGEFGLLVDTLYARFGDERMTRQGALDAELTQSLGELALGYRLGRWPTSSGEDAVTITAELYAGARLSRFEVAVSQGTSQNATQNLIDPMIGVRIPVQLSPHWLLSMRGDIGGFGVDSDLVWNLVFGMERGLSSSLALQFGYRIMRIDFSTDAGDTDREVSVRTIMHGPGFAGSYRF